MADTTLGIRVDRSTRDRLKALGKLKERSPHWLLKKALDDYLSREEHWEKLKKEDRARWDHYLQTGESFSLDRVSAWMKDLREGKRRRWPR